ncbi:MAG: adenylate/guanylate cyclase domain-containing protein [Candidatus Cloacimonetes bacterium]|nr:adenylate/guanylate cyclase domain-containing protein [Candidatus Cloacimonadota bacterium]
MMIDDDLVFGGDFFDLETELSPTSDKLYLREGELRDVSILFGDIKGFSSISNLFDAETIHKKMDELMKIFSRCISFYGGFVDKYMGDGIMALFGAKQASEQDTERAIMAALKMQQQLKLYNKMLRKQAGFETIELGLRIGINTGMVSVGKVGADRDGDFTVYGPEVNLASRMESNAPVNQIMLPRATMKQVIRSFEFESVGEKSVKGFDEPIECFIVLSPKMEGSLHRRNHTSHYVGRAAELAKLQDVLNTTESHLSSLVHIRGDAGLGKTRLVYEFELANQDHAIFLHGACSAISPAPLNLFSSVLESYFKIQLNEVTENKLKKLNAAFLQLATDINEEAKQELNDIQNLIAFLLEIKLDDPRLKQSGTDLLNHLSMAIETFIRIVAQKAMSQGKPLVMILDDLHWLDEASSRVLENLLHKFSGGNGKPLVLWVLMSRMEFKLPTYMTKLCDTCELILKPLEQQDITTLVNNFTTGLELPEDTINKVIMLSDGNPFFLEEWCNYIESLPKAELYDFPVPANLHSLIITRLDRLPVALRMLLHRASVIGQDFFVEILRFIESRLHEPIDIDSTLSSLEEQSLIFRMLGFDYSTYFFKHITTREVAYQTLLVENRKVLHQLCGEAIEQLYPERLNEFYFALAEHYTKADVADKALKYLEKAALAAANIYNNAQALELYNQMLSFPSIEATTQLEIRIRIADIQWLTGEWKPVVPEVQSILTSAEQLDAKHICFNAHRFLGIAAFYMKDLDAAYQELSKAKAIASELADPLLSCIASGNLSNWYFQKQDFAMAKALQLESLRLAQELNETQRQAKSLSNLGMIAMAQEGYIEAEQYFNNSLAIAETNRLMKEKSIALGNLGYVKMKQSDHSSALPYLQAKLDIAEKMNDYLETIKALGNISDANKALGNLSLAVQNLERIHVLKLQKGDDDGAERTAQAIKELQEV